MKRLIWALALLAPAAALGYVLSGPAVLRKLVAHREELQLTSMQVKGTLKLAGDDAKAALAALALPESTEASLPATFLFKMPGRCRLELDAKAGAEAPAAVNVNGAVRAAGPELPLLKFLAADLCPLLDGRGEAAMEKFAREAGIDSAKVSLGRVGTTVAYVVGAQAREANVASLWVEKEHFQPLRVVPKPGGSYSELRLLDFNSAAAGEWHPRVVEVRKGEEVVARFTLEKVEPNQKLADALF